MVDAQDLCFILCSRPFPGRSQPYPVKLSQMDILLYFGKAQARPCQLVKHLPNSLLENTSKECRRNVGLSRGKWTYSVGRSDVSRSSIRCSTGYLFCMETVRGFISDSKLFQFNRLETDILPLFWSWSGLPGILDSLIEVCLVESHSFLDSIDTIDEARLMRKRVFCATGPLEALYFFVADAASLLCALGCWLDLRMCFCDCTYEESSGQMDFFAGLFSSFRVDARIVCIPKESKQRLSSTIILHRRAHLP